MIPPPVDSGGVMAVDSGATGAVPTGEGGRAPVSTGEAGATTGGARIDDGDANPSPGFGGDRDADADADGVVCWSRNGLYAGRIGMLRIARSARTTGAPGAIDLGGLATTGAGAGTGAAATAPGVPASTTPPPGTPGGLGSSGRGCGFDNAAAVAVAGPVAVADTISGVSGTSAVGMTPGTGTGT